MRRAIATLVRGFVPLEQQSSILASPVASCSSAALDLFPGQAHYASRSINRPNIVVEPSTRQLGAQLGARGRPSAVEEALATASELPDGQPHAGGYGQPAVIRTWQRGGGKHWRSAWDGTSSGRTADALERKQRRKQHEQQQRKQSVWQPEGQQAADADTSFPLRPAYRFVGTSRLAPPPGAAVPAWQVPQLERRHASSPHLKPASEGTNNPSSSSPAPAQPAEAKPRPPIYFPNFTLEMMKLTSAQEEQVKAMGWLPEVVFKTQPHVTKLEIKGLLEALYGLDVERVATINYLGTKVMTMDIKGKSRMWRRDDWKKAYVRLRPPTGLALPSRADAPASGPVESFMERVRRVRAPSPAVAAPSTAVAAAPATA